MKPIVSFVIIEYFSLEDIQKCISSISKECDIDNYEIIISSNSKYPIHQQKQIVEDNPNARWIFNPMNGGFAYGMNQGLRYANGDFRVIMNPDVKIHSGLKDMIQFMREHPEIGAIAPKIRSEENEIQDSCRPYVSLQSFAYRLARRVIERKTAVLANDINYDIIQTVDWVIGAFIMVRESAYFATEGLDESYFMYGEDLDWCTRIRKSGFEIAYFPLMEVTYKGSRSARHSWKYAKIFFRSHMHYWKKFGFFYGYPKRNKQIWKN